MIRALSVLLVIFVAGCASVAETTKAAGNSLEKSIIDMMTYSSEDESRPPKLLEEFDPELNIVQVWQDEYSEGQGNSFLKLEMVASDGRLYVADYEGLVIAIDQEAGETLWEVETKLPISGGLGASDDALFFGTTDAEVVALNLNDGDTLWTTQVSSEVLSIPRYAEDTVVIRTVDGAVTALNAETGEEKWSFVRDVPALSLRGTSSPVLKSGGVITGYANGNLVVLRLKDGMQIWESSVAVPRGRGALDRMVDVDADPYAGERFVYAATFNGGLVAVDVRSGEITWRRSELSSFKKMVADWVSLFVVDVDNHIWSVDQTTGTINWQQDALEHRQITPLVLMGEYLLTADFEGYLHVLSASDGHLMGRLKVSDEPIVSEPVIDGDTIYLQDIEGEITALKITSLADSDTEVDD
ncbi:MAG: outer membrane protein assembly factor BamB [Piscirickettsiaceae bacterium]|nr:MAG: outer membrane protein assembly factor BamB [Piscirickettsiaceae bacterium]